MQPGPLRTLLSLWSRWGLAAYSQHPSFDATTLRSGGSQLVKRPDSPCVIEPVLRVFKFLSDVVAVEIAVAKGQVTQIFTMDHCSGVKRYSRQGQLGLLTLVQTREVTID